MRRALRQEDAAGSPGAWMAAQTARTAVPTVRTIPAVEPLERGQERTPAVPTRAMAELPSPLPRHAQSIPAWGQRALQPSVADEGAVVATVAAAAAEVAPVAIAADAALEASPTRAPMRSQMAADPSHPDREGPSVARLAMLNPGAKPRGVHLRPRAWADRSAPEWRLRRYRPSTERARLTEEPLLDPLEKSSGNPDS
jgi:hypothetical protein